MVKGEVSVVNSNGVVVCSTITSSLDVYKVARVPKSRDGSVHFVFSLLPYILIISEILFFYKFYLSISITVRTS